MVNISLIFCFIIQLVYKLHRWIWFSHSVKKSLSLCMYNTVCSLNNLHWPCYNDLDPVKIQICQFLVSVQVWLLNKNFICSRYQVWFCFSIQVHSVVGPLVKFYRYNYKVPKFKIWFLFAFVLKFSYTWFRVVLNALVSFDIFLIINLQNYFNIGLMTLPAD